MIRRIWALGLAGALSSLPCPALASDAARGSATHESASTSPGGARVVQLLRDIEASLKESHYSPITRVDPKLGTYVFDCSGMAAWVLKRAAPAAYQSVLRRSSTGRVVARDFVREIGQVAPDRPSFGWERVARIEDARPGDVIAWLKPAWRTSNITGHVAFVVEAPSASHAVPGAFVVRIADASRYQHEDDTRAASGRDGFGAGRILLTADPETGGPVSYGWFGELSAWVAETQIVIGRPRR